MNFEIFGRHLYGDVKRPLAYVGLEFRRKFWAGDINFRVPAFVGSMSMKEWKRSPTESAKEEKVLRRSLRDYKVCSQVGSKEYASKRAQEGTIERQGRGEKQKPRERVSWECSLRQIVYLVMVKQTKKTAFCFLLSLSSHHCIQTAMDLEMQQAPDEIHPCRVKCRCCHSCNYFCGGRFWFPQHLANPQYVQPA